MDKFQFESGPSCIWLAAEKKLCMWNWKREREGGDRIQGDLNDSFCVELQGWLSEYEQPASGANFIHG